MRVVWLLQKLHLPPPSWGHTKILLKFSAMKNSADIQICIWSLTFYINHLQYFFASLTSVIFIHHLFLSQLPTGFKSNLILLIFAIFSMFFRKKLLHWGICYCMNLYKQSNLRHSHKIYSEIQGRRFTDTFGVIYSLRGHATANAHLSPMGGNNSKSKSS